MHASAISIIDYSSTPDDRDLCLMTLHMNGFISREAQLKLGPLVANNVYM
jgi:hypothetical protein